MKKLMALVLSVSMVLCMMPSMVFADDIKKIDLAGNAGEITGVADTAVYTGENITFADLEVSVVVAEVKTTLKAETDYDVAYTDNKDAGTATVTVTGKGDYTGTITETFTITPKAFTAADKPEITIPTQTVGDETMKNVEIVWNGKTLAENTDYTIKGDNSKAGTQKATVTFQGNFSGTVTADYNVVAKNIADAALYLTELNKTYTYDGTEQKPAIRLVMDGKELTEGDDYILSYENNVNAGTAAIKVIGTGMYSGEQTKDFAIGKAKLSDVEVVFAQDAYTVTGKPIEPTYTVTFNGKEVAKDEYTAAFTNNEKVGNGLLTLTAANKNFTGTKTAEFKIADKAVEDLTVTLDKTSFDYDGTEKKPVATVKDGETVLKEGTDYTVAYVNNTNAGTASVVITGMGGIYEGTKIVEFKINGKKAGIITGYNTYNKYWPSSAAFSLKARSSADETGFTYTANNPDIATVDGNGVVTLVGTGKATITIKTEGTKAYNPITKTVTIYSKPLKPTIKVTSTKKNEIKIVITKVPGATKYSVRYGRKGVYYYKYPAQVEDGKDTITVTLKNRQSGGTYYIKVRAYKTMPDNEKVRGNWTKTYKIKSK